MGRQTKTSVSLLTSPRGVPGSELVPDTGGESRWRPMYESKGVKVPAVRRGEEGPETVTCPGVVANGARYGIDCWAGVEMEGREVVGADAGVELMESKGRLMAVLLALNRELVESGSCG